ncbi:teichoic acid ABC transporter ATP-binding protein [Candidatus Peregrinibacteria bacterium CG10_big_fil_rev_8_21_14_0_10_55_24]|nr:MAG: teichoic acid ABC transporter ATP-binding protein [Candidatus Peregrinibacteria bacterium CG10_big_fil_rev_8_21_14_0_10_55_24]
MNALASTIGIHAEDLHKRFRIDPHGTLFTKIVAWANGWDHSFDLWAVRGISLDVRAGQVVGIVGRNGSGKSTLLRLIAGIYRPSVGQVEIKGRLVSLIDLGSGMQQRMTLRDNIYVQGTLLNMTREMIEEAFDSILEFAELTGYEHLQLFQCSNGMRARLCFSIALHSAPQVLLLDEVFSAGDGWFVKKSQEAMEQLIKSNIAVVQVSHNSDLLRKICDRVLWLEQGSLRMEGDPIQVLDAYEKSCNQPGADPTVLIDRKPHSSYALERRERVLTA